MEKFLERTKILIGEEKLKILKNSKVAIFGIGGVGSFVVEGLARCGVGQLILIDNDVVSESNINRQIIATNSTIGKYKVDVIEERIGQINPNCLVKKYKNFILEDSIKEIPIGNCDYVVDAIDTITGKLAIIKESKLCGTKIISCMGTGNRLDPLSFRISDINETKICPVCKVMRKLLKQNNIKNLKVLYSIENPIKPQIINNQIEKNQRKQILGSISFVPSVAGMFIAGEVVKDLINFRSNEKDFS